MLDVQKAPAFTASVACIRSRKMKQFLHMQQAPFSQGYFLVFAKLLCLSEAKKGARCFLDASDLPPDEDDEEGRTAANYRDGGRPFHKEGSARFKLNM